MATEGLRHLVEWLMDTYEMTEGESLPRSIVYTHYQEFCTNSNVEPVNPASFGKLIRTVFAGLKTRRLGTRGHSKYHYFGIRIKSGSAQDGTKHQHHELSMAGNNGQHMEENNNNSNNMHHMDDNMHHIGDNSHHIDDNKQAYLGEYTNIVDNNWLPLNECAIIESYNDVTTFEKIYKAHYQEIIHSIFNLRFNEVEKLWFQFWHPDDINYKTLYRITTSNKAFTDWIVQIDYNIYSAIETGLLPDILSPVPPELNQEIRQFAKNVGPWMEKALSDYDSNFSSSKCKAARALGYTLRRYTALNHLATTARRVWDSKATMQQMYMDLNRVDLKDVQLQASLITECHRDIPDQVVSKFMNLINSPKPSENWPEWCNDLVKSKLRGDDIDSARRFMLKWNFYSSLIMKDLTLRSSTSFGSFHLIRLLFDEYLFYLIVCQLAQSHRKTPTQLLCEYWIGSDGGQTI